MSAHSKVVKPDGAELSELEVQVSQALYELESVTDLKVDLRPLHVRAAKEVDLENGRKAIVLFVPVPLLKQFHKIQDRLVRELEKKFSDRHILIVALRKILNKPARGKKLKQQRPRSRTLTTVHEALLEDLVYPSEIVGKRTRVKVDGTKTIKIFLDAKDKNLVEYKLDSFSAVYRKITGKNVIFEFPIQGSE